MVYQRFLDPNDTRARHVKMKLNGVEVQPWNPFCPLESQVVSEEAHDVGLPDGTTASFRMKAFVLPRKRSFPPRKRQRTHGSATQPSNSVVCSSREGWIKSRDCLVGGPIRRAASLCACEVDILCCVEATCTLSQMEDALLQVVAGALNRRHHAPSPYHLRIR